jgi:hypothetical protein
MEFSKDAGRAAALTFAPENLNGFDQEMREAKSALLAWRDKHGANCEMVMFTVVCEPQLHGAVESSIER